MKIIIITNRNESEIGISFAQLYYLICLKIKKYKYIHTENYWIYKLNYIHSFAVFLWVNLYQYATLVWERNGIF